MSKLPFRLVSQARIVVSLGEKILYFYQGPTLLGTYPIAVGKSSTPTPSGTYEVFEKIVNPGGVFGSRWLGFYKEIGKKWGIHGTNNPNSIGNEISLGCIRMYNEDVETIFPLVSIGTPVEVVQFNSGGYQGYTPQYPVQINPGLVAQDPLQTNPGLVLQNPAQVVQNPIQTNPALVAQNPAPVKVPGSNNYPVGSGSTYYVRKGDTLWSVAASMGLAIGELLRLNNIPDPHNLEPGQALRLPKR